MRSKSTQVFEENDPKKPHPHPPVAKKPKRQISLNRIVGITKFRKHLSLLGFKLFQVKQDGNSFYRVIAD